LQKRFKKKKIKCRIFSSFMQVLATCSCLVETWFTSGKQALYIFSLKCILYVVCMLRQ